MLPIFLNVLSCHRTTERVAVQTTVGDSFQMSPVDGIVQQSATEITVPTCCHQHVKDLSSVASDMTILLQGMFALHGVSCGGKGWNPCQCSTIVGPTTTATTWASHRHNHAP